MKTHSENFSAASGSGQPAADDLDFLRKSALTMIGRRIGQIDYNQDNMNRYHGDGKMFLRERDERVFLERERKGVALPGLTGIFRAASTIWAIAKVSPQLLLPKAAPRA